MERTAIIGVGQTKQEKNKRSENFADMVYEATVKALTDAGIGIEDIDNVVTVSNDFWDGRTISSMAINDACGAHGKNISTVEGDGTFGALYGLSRVLSGAYRNTLVVAHSKGSESDSKLITNAIFDPIYVRPLGLDAISSSALQARAYMERFGAVEEDFARVSVKNRANGLGNPNAQIAGQLTIEDVMKSRMLADPIKLHDASPVSDGAAAIIIASDEFAKRLSKKPVYVKGTGTCSDAYNLGERDLTESPALRQAARTAYEMAGIADPLKELDVIELYDAFSYMELMWYEGLGLCSPGEASALVRNGVTDLGGDLPVNPSGGCLCAHTVIAAGLIRIIEAVLQLRGEAGKNQAPGAKTALAHGINGACGQAHCVWVLGVEK